MSHPHTSGILAAQLPRCGEKARKNARWNFVDLNVLEIQKSLTKIFGNPEISAKFARNPEIPANFFWDFRNPGNLVRYFG